MVLADTSVWIDHLVRGDAILAELLHANRVLAHSTVIGEIACIRLNNRGRIPELLSVLPPSPVATSAEALAFIEAHRLWGLGLGLVDVHLLAAAKLSGSATLFTRDRAARWRRSQTSSDCQRPGERAPRAPAVRVPITARAAQFAPAR